MRVQEKLATFFNVKIAPYYTDIVMAIFGLGLLAFVFHYFDTAIVYPQNLTDVVIVILVALGHTFASTTVICVTFCIIGWLVFKLAKLFDFFKG